VYHRDVLQMIDEDWSVYSFLTMNSSSIFFSRLCDVRLTSVRVKLDLSSVALNKNGDFASTSLARVMNTPSMNELVVRTWLDRAGMYC
jgi:ATP-dependent helicase IRC3